MYTELTPELLKDYKKIVVLGTTGSGKSTYAQLIGKSLGISVVELDVLRWKPNWISTTDDEFKKLVQASLMQEKWVVDGNYGIVRDIIWSEADVIIWLDFSFFRIFLQLLKRTVLRCFTHEIICNGNTENFYRSFFSKDSILLWALQSHPLKKKKYPDLLIEAEARGLRVFRLSSTKSIHF